MQVKDLQSGKSVDRIELKVTEVGEPRTWSNARGSGTVAKAVAKDDTGEIALTLWNADIGKVKKGDSIVIENGWVSEYQNEKQVSTGRFGKLTVKA
jgi:ssDNA-binding replication factor A large subunit